MDCTGIDLGLAIEHCLQAYWATNFMVNLFIYYNLYGICWKDLISFSISVESVTLAIQISTVTANVLILRKCIEPNYEFTNLLSLLYLILTNPVCTLEW